MITLGVLAVIGLGAAIRLPAETGQPAVEHG